MFPTGTKGVTDHYRGARLFPAARAKEFGLVFPRRSLAPMVAHGNPAGNAWYGYDMVMIWFDYGYTLVISCNRLWWCLMKKCFEILKNLVPHGLRCLDLVWYGWYGVTRDWTAYSSGTCGMTCWSCNSNGWQPIWFGNVKGLDVACLQLPWFSADTPGFGWDVDGSIDGWIDR